MRRRVPPGGISQLITDTDLLFPATWKPLMFTFLTVPRAHSRIHRIANPEFYFHYVGALRWWCRDADLHD